MHVMMHNMHSYMCACKYSHNDLGLHRHRTHDSQSTKSHNLTFSQEATTDRKLSAYKYACEATHHYIYSYARLRSNKQKIILQKLAPSRCVRTPTSTEPVRFYTHCKPAVPTPSGPHRKTRDSSWCGSRCRSGVSPRGRGKQ